MQLITDNSNHYLILHKIHMLRITQLLTSI